MAGLDVRRHIHELISEYGSVTVPFIMQSLVYYDLTKEDMESAIAQLVCKGVICQPSPDTLKLVD